MKIGIIGGGPSGLFTAISLKQRGFDVVVFESSTFSKPRTGEHLAAEVLHEFRKLGIPEALLINNSIPCTEVRSIWGQADMLANESIFNPYGAGFILSRPNFDDALFNYCLDLGIEALKETKVVKVVNHRDKWKVQLSDSIREVDFLIDASGRNSKFRLGQGVKKHVFDQLIGITKYIEPHSNSVLSDSYLLLEAAPKGWWYSVELGSGVTIATFMTDARILSGSGLSMEAFWEERLMESGYTKIRLNQKGSNGRYSVASAQSQTMNQLTGKNWLTVGDAALSYDPLSSAGIIKGIKMGQKAAAAISDYYNNNETAALARYETQLRSQLDDYLELKEAYYLREKRWMREPFWFQRNLKPQLIQHFTIHPNTELQQVETVAHLKWDFIKDQFPSIDIKSLLASIELHTTAKDIVKHYLTKVGQAELNQNILQVLESLKLIGVIRTV